MNGPIALVDMVPELNATLDQLSKQSAKSAFTVFLLQNIGILTGIFSLFILAKFQDKIQIDFWIKPPTFYYSVNKYLMLIHNIVCTICKPRPREFGIHFFCLSTYIISCTRGRRNLQKLEEMLTPFPSVGVGRLRPPHYYSSNKNLHIFLVDFQDYTKDCDSYLFGFLTASDLEIF